MVTTGAGASVEHAAYACADPGGKKMDVNYQKVNSRKLWRADWLQNQSWVEVVGIRAKNEVRIESPLISEPLHRSNVCVIAS